MLRLKLFFNIIVGMCVITGEFISGTVCDFYVNNRVKER